MSSPFNNLGKGSKPSGSGGSTYVTNNCTIGSSGSSAQFIVTDPSSTIRNTINLTSAVGHSVGLAIVAGPSGIYVADDVFRVTKGDGKHAISVGMSTSPGYSIITFDSNSAVVFKESPLQFKNSNDTRTITLSQPTTWTNSYALILPGTTPGNNTLLKHTSGGQLSWISESSVGGGGGGGGNNYFPSGW